MALQKQPVTIDFSKGLDTKTDPYQIAIGNFPLLKNSIFTTAKRLTKRNGFGIVTTLPDDTQTTLTTLNDNLIATGTNLLSFSQDTDQWLNKGPVVPVDLSVVPVVRVSTSQSSPDAAIAPSGLTCITYVDNAVAYYQVSDSASGEQVVPRTTLPSTARDPRAFQLGAYFIITFKVTMSGTPHLRYIAVPIGTPASPGVATDISTTVSNIDSGYDAFVTNNTLYVAWEGSAGAVKIAYLTSSLTVSAASSIAGSAADLMSVTADVPSQRIYISFWDNSGNNGYTAAFDYSLNQVMAKTQIIFNINILEITSVADSGLCSVFYETVNTYSYSPNAKSDYVSIVTVTPPGSGTGAGTASSPLVILRSVGLASKAFIAATGSIYMLAVYGDTNQSPSTNDSNQSTYFLIDSTGAIIMRLAYENAGGYMANQVLPSVVLLDDIYCVPYLVTDFLASVNKTTDPGQPTAAIYTQKGINLAAFDVSMAKQYSSEIASSLFLTGGQLWQYDGVKPVEYLFQVWPENVAVTTATGSGSLSAQQYNYVFTYEWTDAAGNLQRSAPSIPVAVTTTTASSTNTMHVPTLRLTHKVPPNPVRIVGYRWSTNQQEYFQFTSLTSPAVNDTTTDSVTITDTLADSSIIGNTLLYTTGGVVENIAPPASVDSCLYKSRLFLISAEDRNLLVYSKQVIESTTVEMSDLFTIFVAPTSGAQGSTGPMEAITAMDDKLIIFKANALYYITGNGPDNTGANNDFSDPTFITSVVGCSNPSSIVMIPAGVMFQSNKGIWILGRDLSTNYIGAPVEAFNSNVVKSANVIPGTNEVRFVLDNGITLMYDYYFQQWGEHTNVKAISATTYQGLNTYLNSAGRVYQEAPGTFLDGSTPVLMSLTTSWINVAGLQGFERFYFANLLGTYKSPFKLSVSLAYNYNPSPIQIINVTPDDAPANWGGETLWGTGAGWGGTGANGNVFSARIFPEVQKCQSFQMTIQEVYDRDQGLSAGEGLSLSGIALIVGMKKGYRTQSARKSFG